MFQTKWSDAARGEAEEKIGGSPSGISRQDVELVLNMSWEEHCVECAVPECYATCPIYEKRVDGACARLVYGIYPNQNFTGRHRFGADVKFRKWGKIEAHLDVAYPSPPVDHWLLRHLEASPKPVKNFVKRMLTRAYCGAQPEFDAFVLECYSPHEGKFKLLLEYFTEKNNFRMSRFRHAFVLNGGYNFFSIPFEKFNLETLEGYLCLYPESSDPQKRVIFTWLDFVKYRKTSEPRAENAPKIKCLAWDLDNTIWKGVLSEDAVVYPDAEALKLIRQLDERGILQTIISKNDHEPAWQKLVEMKLDHYFLFPAINWGQKSENLSRIVRQLNIGMDACAVIDDSPFEREEISKACPEVRVYSEKQIPEILSYSQFQGPVTQMSRHRRLSYQVEAERVASQASFSGSYEQFLRNCHMVVHAFVPRDEADVLRCWELIQRSNQLNLSTRRYAQAEFSELLRNKAVLSVALRCKDKFGDYGIIGFATVRFPGEFPVLEDFVLSCRVAQKRIEHTFIREIARHFLANGYAELRVTLVKTAKNRPLQQVFKDLPFSSISDGPGTAELRLLLTPDTLPASGIMHLELHDSVAAACPALNASPAAAPSAPSGPYPT